MVTVGAGLENLVACFEEGGHVCFDTGHASNVPLSHVLQALLVL